MGSLTQHEIGAMLETAGARPRGNRHDCPKCGGVRTVTHTPECFYCHRCQWKGNAVSLAKELGVYRRLSPAEYRELRQNRDRANRAAWALYGRVKARRLERAEELRGLGRIELQAHEAGPDYSATWSALALVYRERPRILADLTILESHRAVDDLLRFLSAPEARERML